MPLKWMITGGSPKSVKSLAGHVQGGRIQGVASLEPSTRGRLHEQDRWMKIHASDHQFADVW